MIDSPFLDRVFLEWPLLEWLEAIGLAVGVVIVLYAIRTLAARHFRQIAERTKTRIDDVIIAVIRGARTFFIVLAGFMIAATVLRAPDAVDSVVYRVFFLALLLQVGLWGNDVIGVFTDLYTKRKEDGEVDPSRLTAFRAFGLVGRIVLWSMLVILALDNFGVDITALVTGLGIGGIAVALAVQNVLKDVLAYVSILVDQPFVIEDFLMVGDMAGTVEHIGIKSTRLRSLSGEQLIFSNEDLLSSRIRNFKRMFERRVVFQVGVEYGTPDTKLEAIPAIIREAIEEQPDVRFDRAHFKSFADSSLLFEAVYFVLVPDYAVYMDRQQAINMVLYRRFDDEGIAFAFPTQTLHVASLPADAQDA